MTDGLGHTCVDGVRAEVIFEDVQSAVFFNGVLLPSQAG